MDKPTEVMLAALKQALSEPGEHCLVKSGKQPGLFASKAGVNAEAAAAALEQGYLEMLRSEIKGKTTLEWVKITPKGIDFVQTHESPLRVLEELRGLMKTTHAGVPAWLAELQQEWRQAGSKLFESVQRMAQKIEHLTERVEAALCRAEVERIERVDGAAPGVSWARDALSYLDHRGAASNGSACPLPELFGHLKPLHGELSIPAFLAGLQKLHHKNAVQLVPFDPAAGELPEPEYALVDGASVMYYVTR